ncbi:glycine zipper family protein [Bartonella queenslandensis]|uniref:glycine zipper family protein n=1 Tax=Bartonella queenslandensis TaxID=481138 RepID=UPI001BA630BA|nr:glycine zipper family protein [Bartonella queenslandensis]
MAYVPYSRIVDDVSDNNSGTSSVKKGRANQGKKTTSYIPYSPLAADDKASFNSKSTTDYSPLEGKDWTELRALWSKFMSGLTAGYSDEMQAANEAGFTDYWRGDKKAEEIYNRRVAKERAYQKALQEKHPWLSSGAYIAGSILPTLASFGIPALNFLRAGSTLGSLGRGALVGAGSGALHGSGAGEGYNDTVHSALAGAAGGAVLTPAAALGGMGISKVVRGAGNLVKDTPIIRRVFNPSRKEVSNKALREVAKHLYDNKTESIIERLSSEPHKVFLTDINEKLRQALWNSSKTNEDVYNILKQAHEKRLGGSVQRLDDVMEQTIAPYQHRDTLSRTLKRQGKEAHDHLYEQARQTTIGQEHYPVLDKLFENKGFQRALKEAVKTLEEHPLSINPRRFYDRRFSSINYKPTIELLDQTKKSLDDLIEKSKKSRDNQKVLGYEILKQDLVKIMDEISPTYKAARGSAEKFKNFADSFEKGRQALGTKFEKSVERDAVKENLSKGNWTDKNNTYKMGMRDALHDLLTKNDDPINEFSKLLKQNLASENLERTIGPERFSTFKKAVDQEKFYSDAAKEGFSKFEGTPEFSLFDGLNFSNMWHWPTESLKLARNIFFHPNAPEALRARQELERGIAKLATFGIKGMERNEIANLIQSALKWHHRGVLTDGGLKLISRAIAKGLGPSASIEYAK